MKWYKASNDLIDDTKLRLISHSLNIPHAETVATFHSLLTRCSKLQSDDLSEYLDSMPDEINLQLGISNADIILEAFVDKVISGSGKLLGWNDFQANTSTERVKRWRAKKQDETLQNVSETLVTQRRGEEIRVEESRRDKKGEKKESVSSLIFEEKACKVIRENIKKGSYVSKEDKKMVEDFDTKIKAKLKAGQI